MCGLRTDLNLDDVTQREGLHTYLRYADHSTGGYLHYFCRKRLLNCPLQGREMCSAYLVLRKRMVLTHLLRERSLVPFISPRQSFVPLNLLLVEFHILGI